jgi:hypothetical protein
MPKRGCVAAVGRRRSAHVIDISKFLSRHVIPRDERYTIADTRELVAALDGKLSFTAAEVASATGTPRVVRSVVETVRSAAGLETPEAVAKAGIVGFAVRFLLPNETATIDPSSPTVISRFFMAIPFQPLEDGKTAFDNPDATPQISETVSFCVPATAASLAQAAAPHVCVLTNASVLCLSGEAAKGLSAVVDAAAPPQPIATGRGTRPVAIVKRPDRRVIVAVDAHQKTADAAAMLQRLLSRISTQQVASTASAAATAAAAEAARDSTAPAI